MTARSQHYFCQQERSHLEGDLKDLQACAKELVSAAEDYAQQGLALQQKLGEMSGPDLEKTELYLLWEAACLKHGQLIEALNFWKEVVKTYN